MTTMTAQQGLTLLDMTLDTPRAGGPEWVAPLRDAAMARFTELGIPTLKHEEWRFTNLAPLTKTRFGEPSPRSAARPDDLATAGIDIPGAFRLVFVDGRLLPGLSRLAGLPAGVTVAPLHEALKSSRARVEPFLARSIQTEQDPFAALNSAFFAEGAFIHIPRGLALERPIILQSFTTASAHPTLTHPRNLILLEEGAQATIVEDYEAVGPAAAEAVYFTNALTEISMGAGAHAEHCFLERESPHAFNISTLRVHQEAGSDFSSHSILLGGALVRNNVHLVLDGEACESLLNGLFIPRTGQHMDNHMRVVHAKPRCNSRQYYKGVLDETGRGVFSGRIYVAQDAQKTDAIQRNSNLLLSDQAQIDTKPQLEIYADDVRCTHGATIGQLDPDSLFYLKARGLSDGAARAMLIYAFASESLDRIRLEPLRDHLRPMVVGRLPRGAALLEVL